MIYLKLFLSFLKIGTFTFGGGYAMIPLIQEEVLNNCWMSFLTPSDVEMIKTMIKSEPPYSEIQKVYPISKTFISDINSGKYFYDEKEVYPLCKYRISNDIYDALIEDLIKPELTFKELA